LQDWRWLRKTQLRLRTLFYRNQVERELEEEFRYHIEQRVEQEIASGVAPEEAYSIAVREMEGMEQKKEECRDMRRVSFFENLLQDIRYAWRTLLRAPGFFSIAVATLALGIGANTAIFSLVHSVLFKPLPYREPSRLIIAWDAYLPQGKYLPALPKIGVAPPELDLWRQQRDIFEETAWYRYVPMSMALTAPGAEALNVQAGFLSTDFLHVIGVAPALGRNFVAHESNVALLSDRLWRTRFGSDTKIAGRTVRLNDDTFTVIGVMPASIKFPDWADLFLPEAALKTDELTNPVRHAMGFIGRLRQGVNSKEASARLTALSARLAAENPKTSTGWGMRVANLQEDLTADARPVLLMLLGGVALVLLVACGNVANLMLARASERAREIAVRSALGAGAWRIARQLFTESILLAVAGATMGLVLGGVGLRVLSPVETSFDTTVLLYVLAISVATGLAFGLAPVIQALRDDPNTVIKSGSAASGRHAGTGSALVVIEFAMAVVLVIGAGILSKSFSRLMDVRPGFNPQGLLTMRIAIPQSRDPEALFHRIEEGVNHLPGVDGFASTNVLPLTADHANVSRFNVPGSPVINPDALPAAQIRLVSPDYFGVMHIALRSGRTFNEHDLNEPVVIINQEMARTFWPGKDPVGEKFITGPWGPDPTWSTIIGVAGDVKQFGLDSEPSLDMYLPALYPTTVIVHTLGDPQSLIGPMRLAIQSIGPDLPLSDVRTMDQVVAESAGTRRGTVALLAAFAALALVLALVGVYGVMSWAVAQRTHEIGIRVAMGASARQILRSVILRGMKLSAIGVAIGLGGAFALRNFLASLIFEVSPSDPIVYAAVTALMLLVSFLACYVPARRATRVDPLTALREGVRG
jgi:predicted permease